MVSSNLFYSMRRGFSIVELLVVISIIGLLTGILLPALSRAREQATVLAVNAELRQIGLALDMYVDDHNGKHPPTRKDCAMGWEDHQLPPELVEGGYLPGPGGDAATMSAGMEDRFNKANTYRYWAVGELYQNGRFMPYIKASLYVPDGFPHNEGLPETDIQYSDSAVSPVTWAIFSQGPRFDEWEMIKQLHCPVPKRTWYDPGKRKGIIVRMRLKQGQHIGSFQPD